MTAGMPILSILIFFPVVGALFILLVMNKERAEEIRWVALIVSVIEFLLSLYLPFTFNRQDAGFQWVEKTVWIKRFGMSYYLGADGVSMLLVLLTTFITIVCVLASWRDISTKLKGYMSLLLLVETFSLGIFLALDLFLFYIFWEAVLIPMVFIIGLWGGARRVYSAMKFFIFTFVGSLFMLLGIIALYYYHGKMTGVYTFDTSILFDNPIAPSLQPMIFLALFLGFAVKVPLFPLHTWLPDAHTEAPTAGSIVLAAVLLKLGTYGFVRFSLPLLPNASMSLAPLMMLVAAVAIIYGALVTIAQKDMKKLVAYSSVSHMGFVMLGIFALNIEGLKGSLLQMINHGISTGALFLMVGMIYERTHDRTIASYGGLFKIVPLYGIFFLITVLSSMGFPSTNGFIGELFVLLGTFRANWAYVIPAVIGVLLGAVYLLWLFQRVFLGEVAHPGHHPLHDLGFRETVTALSFAVLVFWIGICPRSILNVMEPSLNRIVNQVEVNSKKAVSAASAGTAASGTAAAGTAVAGATVAANK